jgi:uncharacterized protein YndB with AHSA1/START domain
MPSFDLATHTSAPVEEVWKLLYDPARFPEWWAGIETVQPGQGRDYTLWTPGYPDFPISQRMAADASGGRVTISCLVSDLEYRWQLRETPGGTQIEVHVELPEREADRVPVQQRLLGDSLERLSALARRSPP